MQKGGRIMATYISLINFTQKGIENIKESPKRLEMAKEAFKAMGAELKQFYLCMGRYDVIVISEGPDDETVAKAALTIGSRGAVRTESFRIFNESEYQKLIRELP
jgi:uncharacterized protein with GYD domain